MNGLHHLQRAYQLIEFKRYKAAYQEATQIFKYWPNSRSAYEIMSQCLCEMGKYEEAKVKIKEGLAIDPNNSTLISYLGKIHLEKEEYEKAKKYLKEAVRISPKNSHYYAQLAACYNKEEELTYANKLIDISLSLDPENTNALAFKAQIEAHLGSEGILASSSKEKDLLENALSKDPENPHLHFVKGAAHWRDREYRKAEFHFREVLTKDMNNSEARNLALDCQARRHRFWKYFLYFFPTGRNFIAAASALSFVCISMYNWKFFLEALDGEVEDIYVYNGLTFLVPLFLFWIIRPWLRFNSLEKKLSITTWEIANSAMPIEVMQIFVIISSISLYLSVNGIFFWFGLLASIIAIGVGFHAPSGLNTFYPVFKKPIKTAMKGASLFIGISTFIFLNHSPKPKIMESNMAVNILDLSNGQWKDIKNLTAVNKDSITVLILDNNKLTDIPEEITQFPNIVYLSLRFNVELEFPKIAHLFQLTNLKYLDVYGNSLLIFSGVLQHIKKEIPNLKVIQYDYSRHNLLVGKSFYQLKEMGLLPD